MNNNHRDFFICYNLTEKSKYTKFKEDTYKLFYKNSDYIEVDIDKQLPNTTLYLQAESNENINKITEELYNELIKKYDITKFILIEASDYVLK